eukprot:3621249-Pyramimonas_sp.AAC.1
MFPHNLLEPKKFPRQANRASKGPQHGPRKHESPNDRSKTPKMAPRRPDKFSRHPKSPKLP